MLSMKTSISYMITIDHWVKVMINDHNLSCYTYYMMYFIFYEIFQITTFMQWSMVWSSYITYFIHTFFMTPSLVDYHWPQIQTDLFFFRWDFRLLLTGFEENTRWSQILKPFLINVFCWRLWQDLLWAQGLERWTHSWKNEGEDKMSFTKSN